MNSTTLAVAAAVDIAGGAAVDQTVDLENNQRVIVTE